MIHVHELDVLKLMKIWDNFCVKILIHKKLPETGSRLMQNNPPTYISVRIVIKIELYKYLFSSNGVIGQFMKKIEPV